MTGVAVAATALPAARNAAAAAARTTMPFTFIGAPLSPRMGLAEKGLRDVVPLRWHRLQLGGRLVERDVDDRIAVQRGHPAERLRLDEVGRLEPVARGENA